MNAKPKRVLWGRSCAPSWRDQQIYLRTQNGRATQRELATEYGLSQPRIFAIVRRVQKWIESLTRKNGKWESVEHRLRTAKFLYEHLVDQLWRESMQKWHASMEDKVTEKEWTQGNVRYTEAKIVPGRGDIAQLALAVRCTEELARIRGLDPTLLAELDIEVPGVTNVVAVVSSAQNSVKSQEKSFQNATSEAVAAAPVKQPVSPSPGRPTPCVSPSPAKEAARQCEHDSNRYLRSFCKDRNCQTAGRATACCQGSPHCRGLPRCRAERMNCDTQRRSRIAADFAVSRAVIDRPPRTARLAIDLRCRPRLVAAGGE